MFAAIAETARAEIGLDGLGPYPILQFFGGLVVLATGLLTYFIAGRRRIEALAVPAPPVPIEMHFDGPLIEANALLRRLVVLLEGVTVTNTQLAHLREELSDRRQRLYERIDESERECLAQFDKLELRLRAAEIELARLK
jgi:hypothetical protein